MRSVKIRLLLLFGEVMNKCESLMRTEKAVSHSEFPDKSVHIINWANKETIQSAFLLLFFKTRIEYTKLIFSCINSNFV